MIHGHQQQQQQPPRAAPAAAAAAAQLVPAGASPGQGVPAGGGIQQQAMGLAWQVADALVSATCKVATATCNSRPARLWFRACCSPMLPAHSAARCPLHAQNRPMQASNAAVVQHIMAQPAMQELMHLAGVQPPAPPLAAQAIVGPPPHTAPPAVEVPLQVGGKGGGVVGRGRGGVGGC